jgi:hypothetical protein
MSAVNHSAAEPQPKVALPRAFSGQRSARLPFKERSLTRLESYAWRNSSPPANILTVSSTDISNGMHPKQLARRTQARLSLIGVGRALSRTINYGCFRISTLNVSGTTGGNLLPSGFGPNLADER